MPDFQGEKFDLILVNYVMNCITERRAEVFNTISSQLKIGGYMLLFDFFLKDSPGFTERWIHTPQMRAKREKNRKTLMQTYPYLNDSEIKKYLPEFVVIVSETLIPYGVYEHPSRLAK
ncbi:MAG: hypothetical protein KDD04_04530 [Sinomicrobium sp.]|nr:hypothetical protein [Sinomicrobium sp.]